MSSAIITKAQAKVLGLRYYFTGKPCRRGHTSQRFTYNSMCHQCSIDNSKDWRERNKDKERARSLARHYENPERERERHQKWYAGNKDTVLHKMKMARAALPHIFKDRYDRYYAANRDAINQRTSEYAKANRESVNRYYREYRRRRASSDPVYRSSLLMRALVRRTLRSSASKRSARTVDMLGYSPDEFCAHIERQFLKGMKWENYGEWHIDHIQPLAGLIRSGVSDPKAVNALSNLRPMWARANRSKGAKRVTLL